MNIGMLWFDNDQQLDLLSKINRAAAYYQNKYGQKPDLCFVHPTMASRVRCKTVGIEIRISRRVSPNHLWMGLH